MDEQEASKTIAGLREQSKYDLIRDLVPLGSLAKAYFADRGKHSPVLPEAEYTRVQLPADAPGYLAQNPGLPDHPFGQVYRAGAQIWAHKDLAAITLRAAEILQDENNWNLKVMDCLRTVEAQQAMQKVVKENNWSEDYVSSPGSGPHPRAMAVDLVPVDAETGRLVDMGSPFDHFGEASNRTYRHLTDSQRRNREILNGAMMRAATELGMADDLELLASEWWDFRFKKQRWSCYSPLSDLDLPAEMRMTDRHPTMGRRCVEETLAPKGVIER